MLPLQLYQNRLFLCLATALALWAFPLSAFESPECAKLETWAGKRDESQSFQLTPTIAISNLLSDAFIVPLVGEPVITWTSQQLGQFRRDINQCRKLAYKRKDTAVATQLYDALKAVDSSRVPLTRLQQGRTRVEQVVTRLVEYRPSERLAGQLALSEDALRGKPVDPSIYNLRQTPNWIPQLQQASDYFSADEITTLATQLENKRKQMEAQFAATDAAYADARQALAGIPLTQAGLIALNELAQSPAVALASPAQIDQFRAEVNEKRMAILTALRDQEQTRKAASLNAQVIDIPQHLGTWLTGRAVDEQRLLDLYPGMPYQQALQRLKSEGFRDTMTLSMTRAYGKGAALIDLQAMENQVGEIDLTERFKQPLDISAVSRDLSQRFGAPDETETIPGGQIMTWRESGTALQILVTNRVHNAVAYKGYSSRLSIGLWHDDYEDYLQALNQRCAELRNKPRNELSTNDAVLLGSQCPLMQGQTKSPGVIKVM